MAMAVLYRTNRDSRDEEAGRTLKFEREKKERRTNAGTVEHQISRLSIAQTPEYRDGAERSGGGDDVANPGYPFGKHIVISSCDP